MKPLVKLILIAIITLTSCSKNEFSMEYYYSLRIDEQQDVNVLLDTSQSDSILFKNTDRPYSSKINSAVDEEKHTIEINGLLLKDFDFDIKKDKTGLDNTDCQGIIGLGIEDGENDLMDKLKEKNIIDRRVLFFTTHPIPKIQFLIEVKKNAIKNFTECSLADKRDLDDSDDLEEFEEGWLCDLTHMQSSNAKSLNDSIVIKGRAMFDAKSYYITAPMEYFDFFVHYFMNNNTDFLCGSFDLSGDRFISCNFTNDYYNSMRNISFVFGGYSYNIDGRKLFTQMENNKYHSLLRFRNISKNIWTFGFPFFSSYVIEFDYDREVVGFQGEKPMNFTDEWNIWAEDNLKKKNAFIENILANRTIMIVGAVSIGLILILAIVFIVVHCVSKRNKEGMMPLKEEQQHKA